MSCFDYSKTREEDKKRAASITKNIKMVPKRIPPTELQLELIAKLKKQLEDYGKDVSYIKEPDDKKVAGLVIVSLLKLCKKYNLRGDK